MGNRNEVGKKGNGKLGNLPSCRIIKKFILIYVRQVTFHAVSLSAASAIAEFRHKILPIAGQQLSLTGNLASNPRFHHV